MKFTKLFVVALFVIIVALVVVNGCTAPAPQSPSVATTIPSLSNIEPIELTKMAPTATPTLKPGDCKDKGLPGLPCVVTCSEGKTPIQIIAKWWECDVTYDRGFLNGGWGHIYSKGETSAVSCTNPENGAVKDTKVTYMYTWLNESRLTDTGNYIAGEGLWNLLSVGLRFCAVYDNSLLMIDQSPNGGEWGAYESLPPAK